MELFFLALLFLLMAFALGSGFPVAFALPGSAILTVGLAAVAGYLFTGDASAFFAQDGPVQWLSAGVTNFRGVYWEAERDTLIAIPLFIFMGIMLQRSKIAEDLLVTMAQLFGPIPGGLGISVVFVGALLAATTGIVGATVVAMGLISLPAMLRANYSQSLATGTIAASGTLGQIIPPSIVLIILADQLASATDQASTTRKADYKEATGELTMPSEFDITSTSAGDMFLGAFLPGLVLVGLYMAFILVIALVRPGVAPPIPYAGKYDWNFAGKVFLALVPPLLLIVIVLGSIIAGVATVNQAGAIGAAGALIMAGYRLHEGPRNTYTPAILSLVSVITIGVVASNFDLNIRTVNDSNDVLGVTLAVVAVTGLIIGLVWSGLRALRNEDTLHGVMVETAKTTSLVFIILLGAAMLTAAFRAFGGEELVRDFLTGLPGGFWTQFVIVMAVIFFLGFFLDFIEIAVVVVPIVAPILLADPQANVTAVWLGVMIGLNIQTSFLTPPFGFALFYLRGVAPATVRTIQIYKGVIAFIGLQLVALVIVAYFPPLVNYLPQRISLTSVTAPPPQNPRLQLCIEDYVNERFAENGDAIRAAVAQARAIDLSSAPEDLREEFAESLEKAEEAFAAMAAIDAAKATVDAASVAYRPLHRRIREIQRDIRRDREDISELQTLVRFTSDDDQKAAFEARIAADRREIEALEAEIPSEWKDTRGAYVSLLKAEEKARRDYRRAVDDAYEPVAELRTVIADGEPLEAFAPRLEELRGAVRDDDPEATGEVLSTVRSDMGDLEGVSDIRSALNASRKALTGRTLDRDKAVEALEEAIALLDAGLSWRRQAREDALPGLTAYEAAIRDTIGLRQQPVLPKEQALYVAACLAHHRDISLNF